MAGKRDNVLRKFRLLILRRPDGYGWQVRFSDHASIVEESSRPFATETDARIDGERALARHQQASVHDHHAP